MISVFNFIFLTFLSTVLFSLIIMFSMNFATTKAHPPYHEVEENNIYVVYKYVRTGIIKGSYKSCKFRLEGDKLVFLKEKIPFPFDLIILSILISFFKKYSIVRAILLIAYFIICFYGMVFINHIYSVTFCKKYLEKCTSKE